MDEERVLAKCNELLDQLYANDDHRKLARLVKDIEALRDRLIAAQAADSA